MTAAQPTPANDCPSDYFDDGRFDDPAGDVGGQPQTGVRSVSVTQSLAPMVPRFEIVDLSQPIPPVNYLIEELDIAAGAPTMFIGASSAGKTMVLQQAALDMALDRLVWTKFRARRGARSLHLNWDQGRWPTITRYQRLAAATGIDLRELSGRLSVVVSPTVFLDGPGAEDVLAREAEGYDFVIIDSWRAACTRTEENASEARIPLDMSRRVSEKTGAVFAWIHHAGHPIKDAPKGRSKVRGRGTTAFRDACDSEFALSAGKGEPTLVEHAKSRMKQEGPDFYLQIEDVLVASDPRGGLRVRHRSPSEVKGYDPAAQHEAVVERIRRALRDNPDVPGKEALCARVGINRTTFYAAFKELENLGEVFNTTGKPKEPRLRWKPRARP